jgi:hypothetical protein
MQRAVSKSFWQSSLLGPNHTCDVHIVFPTCVANGFSSEKSRAFLADPANDRTRKFHVLQMQQCALCFDSFPAQCVVITGLRVVTGTLETGKRAAIVRTCLICVKCAEPVLGNVAPIEPMPDTRQDAILLKYAEKALHMSGSSSNVRELFALGGERYYDKMRDQLFALTPSVCASCKCTENVTKRCARCKLVRYCGAECSGAHWKASHKRECDARKEQRKIWYAGEGRDI